MDVKILEKIEQNYYKNDWDSFKVGDSVKVHNVIREGDKSRTQIYSGLVIAKKGSGTRATFTVRKISDGIGVEKIFPIHSPNVAKVEVTRTGKVRRSKLYYLRERVGKSALKVKQGEAVAAPTKESKEAKPQKEDKKTNETEVKAKKKDKAEETADKE